MASRTEEKILELKINAKGTSATLNDLRKDAKTLRAILNNINPDEKEKAKKLSENLERVNARTKQVKQEMGLLRKEVDRNGNSGKKLGEAFATLNPVQGQLDDINSRLGGTFKGVKTLVSGLNTLKGALLGLGIGALLVVLGAVVTFFTKTQKGARALERILGGVSGVVNKLIQDFGRFGGQILELIPSFEEIKNIDVAQVFVDIGNAIKENIENRIESIGVFGKALKQLFEGDFAEAAKTAGDATIQLATGIEDGTDKIKDLIEAVPEGVQSVLDYGKSLGDAAQQGFNLADQNIRLRQSIRELNVAQAQFQAEAEKNRKIRDDERLSLEERLAANEKVLEFEEKRTKAQEALTNARIQIIKNEAAVSGEFTEEQLDELSELNRELADIQDDFASRTTEVLTESVSISREAAEQQKQIALDQANAILALTQEGSQARLNAQKSVLEAEKQLALQQAENEVTNLEALAARKLLIENEFQASLRDLETAFEEERKSKQEEQRKQQETIDEENRQRKLDEIEATRAKVEAELAIERSKVATLGELANAITTIFKGQTAIAKAALAVQKGVAVANIIISLNEELAAIAANSAKNPLNGPTAGAAGIAQFLSQATIAKVRAGIGIATIAAQSIKEFGLGGSVTGMLSGASHASSGQGGIPILAEGGEFVVKKKAAINNADILNVVNTLGANQRFGLVSMSGGGAVTTVPSQETIQSISPAAVDNTAQLEALQAQQAEQTRMIGALASSIDRYEREKRVVLEPQDVEDELTERAEIRSYGQ